MARTGGFVRSLARAQQQAERRQIAQQRQQQQLESRRAKEALQAQKAYERARVANEKEQQKLYTASRIAHVDWQNEQLENEVAQLQIILIDALSIDPFIDIDSLKQQVNVPPFDPGVLAVPLAPPHLEAYLPQGLSGFQKIVPGAKERHAQQTAQAHERHRADSATYQAQEQSRLQALAQAKQQYDQQVAEAEQQVSKHNADIATFQKEFAQGGTQAVDDYFTMVLNASTYPEGFPQQVKVAYVAESQQLVVEYDLPPFEIVPAVSSYKYVKTKDSITESARSIAQRKALYSSLICQITLRSLHEIYTADRAKNIAIIVFNGYVSSINKATGHLSRTCLVTVRVSRDVFEQLHLKNVDPIECLKMLNASVSTKPDELVPVPPILEFNMADPRFVSEVDILSGLDQRPNLMDLSPSEFESLITNLFQKMGLETRLTRPSRDGGIDCVAYDPRPVLGGKVVIQAKRYKDTVGVSAVRDLYGTMINEGASKGILVATSGYGSAAFEFADGKPLQLLSGSNLLALLSEHAGVEATIIMPTRES